MRNRARHQFSDYAFPVFITILALFVFITQILMMREYGWNYEWTLSKVEIWHGFWHVWGL